MFGYIYITTNMLNNKQYIGLKYGDFDEKYLGSGKCLKLAINKYGRNNFKVKVIFYAYTKEHLNWAEKNFIEEYNAVISDEFYNIAKGGNSWGSTHLEETKRKISSTRKSRNYIPHNKGVPDPKSRVRMILRNPMHNTECVNKRLNTLADKLYPKHISFCEYCSAKWETTGRGVKHFLRKRFCSTSCFRKENPIYMKVR